MDGVTRRALWGCGTLGKVHGLRGELYLNLAADGLQRLERGEEFFVLRPAVPGGDEQLVPCRVKRAGGTAQRPLVRLDVARTREAACELQGCELLAAGEALDAEPHYVVGDLIGLRVETSSGRLLGSVTDVFETPAHEVLQVAAPDGGELLVPLVDELVHVDDAGDEAVLRVVEGLLDEPAEATSGGEAESRHGEPPGVGEP
jgi:16S rRNA processing protein RimM